ncbi:MAG TPA: WS/DGAT domain-containing protein [Propionibacteriaceae bacterium]
MCQRAAELGERIARVEAAVHAQKATGPAPIAILDELFRPAARPGGYRFYMFCMNHQHQLHTLVTHVRGPTEPVMHGGHQVSSAIPVAVSDGGNVTVDFGSSRTPACSPSRSSSIRITVQILTT